MKNLGIRDDLIELSNRVETELETIYKNIENICQICSIKVLNAFQDCGLSEMHLNSSTGYGLTSLEEIKLKKYIVIFSKQKMH